MGSEFTDYPPLNRHREKVFIVVKTYPHPSQGYRETVCTAGVTLKGKWIRLYPINYRYLEYSKWYKKYQWINVEIEKNLKDFRRDSFRPSVNSIIPIGTPLDTKKDKYWLKRKQVIIPTVTYKSLEEIKQLYQSHGISLGIFKPKEMIDLKIEADSMVL